MPDNAVVLGYRTAAFRRRRSVRSPTAAVASSPRKGIPCSDGLRNAQLVVRNAQLAVLSGRLAGGSGRLAGGSGRLARGRSQSRGAWCRLALAFGGFIVAAAGATILYRRW
ncbi:hypothetical protein FCN18_12240 [Prauserella endophytica]|uniref:Uncharacterized protein n=1 Tax=Prauserella endophytica TaxID=1592324 RepID=A0ABY2S6N9_9PSEU|nr:hypothetical protein FCN18_12240 [Prauserella endophytica]